LARIITIQQQERRDNAQFQSQLITAVTALATKTSGSSEFLDKYNALAVEAGGYKVKSEQFDGVKKDHDVLLDKYNAMAVDAEGYKVRADRLDAVSSINDDLKNRNHNLGVEVVAANEKIRIKDGEIELLQKKYDRDMEEQRQKYSNMFGQYQQKLIENTSLSARAANGEFYTKYFQEELDKYKDVHAKNAALKAAKDCADDNAIRCNRTIKEKDDEIKALNKDLQFKTQMISSLTDQNLQWGRDVNALKADNSQLVDKFNAMKAELARLQALDPNHRHQTEPDQTYFGAYQPGQPRPHMPPPPPGKQGGRCEWDDIEGWVWSL